MDARPWLIPMTWLDSPQPAPTGVRARPPCPTPGGTLGPPCTPTRPHPHPRSSGSWPRRGDAARLPPEALQLCEVEPLRQEVPGSGRWIPDELAPSAFCRLPELRRVAITSYDRRFDVWCFPPDSLSEGCGGPELPEEVML